MLQNQDGPVVEMYQCCPSCLGELAPDHGDEQDLAKCIDPRCGWQLPKAAIELAAEFNGESANTGVPAGLTAVAPSQDQWDSLGAALACNPKAWEKLQELVRHYEIELMC